MTRPAFQGSVRDSKDTTGPRLAFGPSAWAGFVEYSRGE
ncbi:MULTISPECIES: DUF397 domain-containing protein [unclassified Streptomyces]